jgi:PKD repeat protein
MPSANIQINGVAASDDDLPINTIVQLNNVNTGGETSYLWEILDQPEGTADVVSSATIQNPTFTPKKEGSYLIRLTVNQGGGDQVVNTKIAAVRQLKSNERVPSAFEVLEVDSAKGWKTATNRLLSRADDALADSNLIVCVNSATLTATVGDIVSFTGISTIKSGLPGEETVLTASQASASSAAPMRSSMLGIVVATPSGAATSAGTLLIVRVRGLVETSVLIGGTPAIGDLVWVGDNSRPSLTPGTNPRLVGKIVLVNATQSYRFVIDGSLAIGARTDALTAIGNSFVVANWTANVAGGYMSSTASGAELITGLPGRDGESLTALTFSRFGTGAANTIVAKVFRLLAAGTIAECGTISATSSAASWVDVTIPSLTNNTGVAGAAFFAHFNADASGFRIGTVRPTFVRAVP